MKILIPILLIVIAGCAGSVDAEPSGEVQQAATHIVYSTIVVNGGPGYNSGWSTSPNVSWPTALNDYSDGPAGPGGLGDANDAIVSFNSGSLAIASNVSWNLAPGEYAKITQILGFDVYFRCHTDTALAELEVYFISSHLWNPGGPPDQYLTLKNCPVWPLQAKGHDFFYQRPNGTPMDKSDFLNITSGEGFSFERSGPAGWLRVDSLVLQVTAVENL